MIGVLRRTEGIGVLIGCPEKDSPSQDSNHPDDLFQSRYVTPGFKTFSSYYYCSRVQVKQMLSLQELRLEQMEYRKFL